jgi:hypothetical protein
MTDEVRDGWRAFLEHAEQVAAQELSSAQRELRANDHLSRQRERDLLDQLPTLALLQRYETMLRRQIERTKQSILGDQLRSSPLVHQARLSAEPPELRPLRQRGGRTQRRRSHR